MTTDDYARRQARNYWGRTVHEFKDGILDEGYPSNHCALCTRHVNSAIHDVERPQKRLLLPDARVSGV